MTTGFAFGVLVAILVAGAVAIAALKIGHRRVFGARRTPAE